MVVENQDFGIRPKLLAEQVSGSQAANARPYDYQIICLIEQLILIGALTFSRQRMGNLKRTGVIAPHTRQRWRIKLWSVNALLRPSQYLRW